MSGLTHTFSSETAQQPADCSPPIKSLRALTRLLPLTIKMFEMETLFLIHDDYPPKAPLPGHSPIQGWLMTPSLLRFQDTWFLLYKRVGFFFGEGVIEKVTRAVEKKKRENKIRSEEREETRETWGLFQIFFSLRREKLRLPFWKAIRRLPLLMYYGDHLGL